MYVIYFDNIAAISLLDLPRVSGINTPKIAFNTHMKLKKNMQAGSPMIVLISGKMEPVTNKITHIMAIALAKLVSSICEVILNIYVLLHKNMF